ncbi:MAG: RNase P subunit p30 family protein [Nanoarchaeota archaeon]
MHIDIVFPNHNEHEFVAMAQCLGWRGLCFFYKNPSEAQQLQQLRTKFQKNFTLLWASTNRQAPIIIHQSTGDDRSDIEQGGFHILYDLEIKQRRDYIHHRASGLNHVLCNILTKKKIVIGYSFESLLLADPPQRSIILGRILQNIKLCRKYETPMLLASFAHFPIHMRSPHDLHKFLLSIGVATDTAKTMLHTTGSFARET